MDENYLPVVVGAAVVGDRVLRLLFSDGTVGDVDFSSERWTGVLEPLNDQAYFTQRMWDFFADHLLGDRQTGADIYGKRENQAR